MKKNFFPNHALCAGLVLDRLLTLSSLHAADNEVKDNNSVITAVPTTNSKIVGTWELTNRSSYTIVRNPRAHKECRMGFMIDRYDDYKFLPVDFTTGEPVDLRIPVGRDGNDLDDELYRFDFYHGGTMSIIEREGNGGWKCNDDIDIYGLHRDDFFVEMDGKMRKDLQIRFLNNNEFELTQTKFDDSDLRRVVVKKVMRYVRVTRK